MPGTNTALDVIRSYRVAWDSSVKVTDGKRQLSIHMAGWDLSDDDMQEWCTWFREFSKSFCAIEQCVVAKDVNASENQLTSVGVQYFLETLLACNVSVLVLKLHHNKLEDGAALANFIRNCSGSLREIHLSHNELTTDAAADVILAAAMAKDGHGAYCYPRIAAGGNQATPLWMRLEQNYLSQSKLLEQSEASFRSIGREGASLLCNVSSKLCTPHVCAQHRCGGTPVIHAKNLSNQRSSPKSSVDAFRCPAANDTYDRRGQDILALLFPKDTGMDFKAPTESTPTDADLNSAPEDRSMDDDLPACVLADVLRWDEDLCKWVKDVIEIPNEPPKAVASSDRVNVSQMVGQMMGDELKSMLKKPVSREQFFSTTPSFNSGRCLPSLPPQGLHGFENPTLTTSPCPTPGDDSQYAEPTSKGGRSVAGTSRSSRRGSQPSSCDVKQSNGFTLNPHATEFFPTFSGEVKLSKLDPDTTEFKPSAIVTRQWNPDAVEFEPSGNRHGMSEQMRGISESLLRMGKSKTAQAKIPRPVDASSATLLAPDTSSATLLAPDSKTSVDIVSSEGFDIDENQESCSEMVEISDLIHRLPDQTDNNSASEIVCLGATSGNTELDHEADPGNAALIEKTDELLSQDGVAGSARAWLEAATVDVARKPELLHELQRKNTETTPPTSFRKVVRLTFSMVSAVVAFGAAIFVARTHLR